MKPYRRLQLTKALSLSQCAVAFVLTAISLATATSLLLTMRATAHNSCGADETSFIWQYHFAGGDYPGCVGANANVKSWSVSTNQSWLRVSPNSGTGASNLTITPQPNSGGNREATMTLTTNYVDTSRPPDRWNIPVEQEGCSMARISQQPSIQTSSGQTATLRVTAIDPLFAFAGGAVRDTSLKFQWFKGERGDTSNKVTDPLPGIPVNSLTSSSSYTTLTAPTKYWVRVTNLCGSEDSNTVLASPPAFTISGRLRDRASNGISDVTITITGGPQPQPTPTATDSSGNYSFSNLTQGGNYNVKPAKDGYRFAWTGNQTLDSAPFNNLTSNQSADFIGTPMLDLLGIEVTQGIQDLQNSVKLIEDRRTVVRVYVKSPAFDPVKPSKRVKGTLIGKRDNAEIGSLETDADVTALTPPRSIASSSFNFELPLSWRKVGPLNLEFYAANHEISKCDGGTKANGGCAIQPHVTFIPAPAFRIAIAGVTWREENGTEHKPDWADFYEVIEEIEATFPVARLDWTLAPAKKLLFSGQPKTLLDFYDLNMRLGVDRALDCYLFPELCNRISLNILVDPPPQQTDDSIVLVGLAANPKETTSLGLPLNLATAYLTGMLTPSHELGHSNGRFHTWDDPAFQASRGSISSDKTIRGFYGYDFRNIGLRLEVRNPYSLDLMNYGHERWPSKITYEGIMDNLRTNFGNASASSNVNTEAKILNKENLPPAVNGGDAAIMVSGIIPTAENTGEIISIYQVQARTAVPTPSPGNYAIRFDDNQGQVLSTYSFEPTPQSEGSGGVFSLFLPFHAGTSRIALLRNGIEINSRQASANGPTVRVINPNGGESFSSSTVTLQWTASDPDNNSLNYIVQHSKDAGTTWQTLTSGLTSTTYELDLSMLAATNQGLIRVLASDGFHTAQDQSDATFRIANHAPQSNISAPTYSRLYVGNETIILEGTAYDPEDGLLGDSSLSWSSNLTGPLGNGRSLAINASNLAVGTHTITLNAKDSDNQTNSQTVTIQVERIRPVTPPTLVIGPTVLNFQAQLGIVQTEPQELAIRNSSNETLNWSSTIDQSWIKLSAITGTAPANVSIVADPTGLAVGQYTGHVTIISNSANGSQVVDVTFNVVDSAPTPTPVWQLAVLSSQQIAQIKAWTLGGRTYVYVKPQFPDAGYRVVNWGQVVRSGSDFTVDASVETFTGASIKSAVTTAQIYDLGPLADGTYDFNFKTSGTLAKLLQFTVSSAVPPQNPIDNAREFVKQQYRDFLNREADQAGEDFWTDNITKCSDPARRPVGQTEAQCTLRQRETTSGAFFLSPEFQYTGYYVYRMYRGALGRQPKLSEFTPDVQFVGAGIVVNGQLSAAKINQNKGDFSAQFVNCTDAAKYRCAEFKAIYDALNNQQYVDKLFQTTGVNASAADRTALVNGLAGGTETRATVLQKVVDGIVVISEGNQQFTNPYGQAFYNSEFNRAFVQLEYFGYMKRDPDDAGYAFWLGKLNQFGGNFVNAEMVLAFISSPEYRAHFGQP